MTTDQIIAACNALATAAGPIVVVVVAILADRRFKDFERGLEERRRVSDTRFALYREIGFQLNDLYVYFTYRGNWKDHSPQDMIEYKRQLDRHIFTYAPLFSEAFSKKYNHFILACFEMYGGWRKDARLRTTSAHRAEEGNPVFAHCFTEKDNRKEITSAYEGLMQALAVELNVDAIRTGS